MKKGCIFDLDGTLVNSLMDLGDSVNDVLKSHGLKTYDYDDYTLMVGNGIRKLIERALGDHLDLLDVCLKEFYDVYEKNCLNKTLPYDGITELLYELKSQGILLAVVTNKPHALAIKIVDSLFPNIFTAIYGQQEIYPIKPDASSTLFALMTLKLKKEDCFFIGDSNVDIDTAYNAHMESIGVCWGFRGEDELKEAGADFVCYHPCEIKELLIDKMD